MFLLFLDVFSFDFYTVFVWETLHCTVSLSAVLRQTRSVGGVGRADPAIFVHARVMARLPEWKHCVTVARCGLLKAQAIVHSQFISFGTEKHESNWHPRGQSFWAQVWTPDQYTILYRHTKKQKPSDGCSSPRSTLNEVFRQKVPNRRLQHREKM